MPYGHLIEATVITLGVCQGRSSVASFSILTSASCSPSAIAELLVKHDSTWTLKLETCACISSSLHNRSTLSTQNTAFVIVFTAALMPRAAADALAVTRFGPARLGRYSCWRSCWIADCCCCCFNWAADDCRCNWCSGGDCWRVRFARLTIF